MVSKSGVSHFDSIFLEEMVPSGVKLWDDMGSHKGSAQFKIEPKQTDSGFFIHYHNLPATQLGQTTNATS